MKKTLSSNLINFTETTESSSVIRKTPSVIVPNGPTEALVGCLAVRQCPVKVELVGRQSTEGRGKISVNPLPRRSEIAILGIVGYTFQL